MGSSKCAAASVRAGVEAHGCDASQARVEAAHEFFATRGVPRASFEACWMPDVPRRLGFQAVLLAHNAIGVDIKDQRCDPDAGTASIQPWEHSD